MCPEIGCVNKPLTTKGKPNNTIVTHVIRHLLLIIIMRSLLRAILSLLLSSSFAFSPAKNALKVTNVNGTKCVVSRSMYFSMSEKSSFGKVRTRNFWRSRIHSTPNERSPPSSSRASPPSSRWKCFKNCFFRCRKSE
jgi:hypothetical protein